MDIENFYWLLVKHASDKTAGTSFQTADQSCTPTDHFRLKLSSRCVIVWPSAGTAIAEDNEHRLNSELSWLCAVNVNNGITDADQY